MSFSEYLIQLSIMHIGCVYFHYHYLKKRLQYNFYRPFTVCDLKENWNEI